MQNRILLPLFTVCLFGFGACASDTSGLDGGAACTSQAECPEGQFCDVSLLQCRPGAVKDCQRDEDCGTDEVCTTEFACEAKACGAHDECSEAYLCIDGACAESPACRPTGTCPAGSVCDGDLGRCVPTPTCANDEDCEPDELCVEEVCTTPGSCTSSTDCPSGLVCQGGTCGRGCQADADCGQPAQAWRCDTGSGECTRRCLGDGTCPAGLICESNLCEPQECEETVDCPGPNQRCEDGGQHGRCVSFTPCTPGGGQCPENFECVVDACQELPNCLGDRACAPDEYCEDDHCQPTSTCGPNTPCATGLDCIGGRCVPSLCRGPADCTVSGEVCIAGACQVPPGTDLVIQVVIITPAGVVRPTETYPFVALALDPSGNAIAGVQFNWNSTAPAVASIDGDGLATGGGQAGVTQITASVTGASGAITSAPVSLRNLGALVAGDVRVSAVTAASGAAVNGAIVELAGDFGVRTAATDATGVAVFAALDPSAPFSVTVASEAHDYVSLLGVVGRDLVVPLPSLTRTDRVGGVRGTVDFSLVQTQGALSVSLSGTSLESPIFGNDPSALLGGEVFTVSIQIPGAGNTDIPLPAGMTLRAEFMGFPLDLKNTFYARARAGQRAVWSIAGRADLASLGLGGGGGISNPVGALLPALQRFEHGLRPSVSVLPLPTIADTADINGNGDTTELVPDYGAFPNVSNRPGVSQNLRYVLEPGMSRLPLVTGGNANTILLVSGTLLPGVGFVPLGFDGLQDDAGNGFVPAFSSRMAPAHGGLEVGEYAILVAAFRLEGTAVPGPGSARLIVAPALPASFDVSDGFLDSPLGSVFSASARELSGSRLASGDLVSLSFKSPVGGWHVYGAPTGGTLALPELPSGATNRLEDAEAEVTVLDLAPGADTSSLFGASAGGTLGIDRATRGYAKSAVQIQ